MNLNKTLKLLICISFPTSCFATNYYVGGSAGYASFTMEERYGRDDFKKNPAMYSLFAGYVYNENWFYELNNDFTSKLRLQNLITYGEGLPGATIITAPNGFQLLSGSYRVTSPSIMVGYKADGRSILKNSELSILAGISYVNFKAQYEVLDDDMGTDQDEIDESRRNFSKRIFIPTFSIYGTYKINAKFGIRAGTNIKFTSRIKLKSKEDPNGAEEIRLKNNYTFNLGVIYSI